MKSFDKDLVLPHPATSPYRILIGESTLLYLYDLLHTDATVEMTLKGKDQKPTASCVLVRAEQQSTVS